MADAVAKAWILNIKAPTGYGCCTRCNSYGVYERGRVCFPEIGELRTDEAFRQQDDDSEKTVLIEIPNFDLVKGIPLDYMHLVCIGVMKRLLQVWTGNRTDHTERRLLGTNMMRKVNLRLQRIGSQYSPCEFARKPRSLKWLANWKSSEYRQFLLYYGPAVLQGVLPEKYFDNFILFHVSIRILTSHNLVQSSTALKLAEGYLNKFVDEAQQLYGRHFAVHNVHSLVHLPSDVQRYGVLDNFSCFPFENFLFKIKKVIRGGNEPLKQFINRYNEWLSVQEPSESCQKDSEISYILGGPLKKDNSLLDDYHQYRYIQNENETFKTDSHKDCYAFLTDKCFAKICQIRQHKVTGEVSFLVKKIKKIESLYSNPVTSMQVGECIVNLTLLEKEIPIVIKNDNISKKCYVMPYKDTITNENQIQELCNHSLHVASSFRH